MISWVVNFNIVSKIEIKWHYKILHAKLHIVLPFWNESFKEKGDVSALQKMCLYCDWDSTMPLIFLAVHSSSAQQ